MNQRWRDRRGSYRPAGEPIQTRAYEVVAIADDAPAKAFVLQHHYAATFPAARFRYGLYRGGALVGVAVFSHPCNNAVLTNVFPVPAIEACELGRFVLLDDVPGNGESWFIARCYELLRQEVAGVVMHSDPVPRTTAAGDMIFLGHYGTIYQSTNAVYLGRTGREVLRLLPDGRVFSRRAIQKIRAKEQGWRYSAAILERHGAEQLDAGEDSRAWLKRWLPLVTRPLRHDGTFRYAWALDKSLRRQLPRGLPYPKKDLPGALQLSLMC